MSFFANMFGFAKNETETTSIDKELRDDSLRNAATADDGTFAQDATLIDSAKEGNVLKTHVTEYVYEDAYDIARNTNDLRVERTRVVDHDQRVIGRDTLHEASDKLRDAGDKLRHAIEEPLARTHLSEKNNVGRVAVVRDETSWEEHDTQTFIEKAPIVHETFRTERVEEIQPVIHREIEQPEYHRVAQPIYEKEINATAVEEKTLAAQFREVMIEKPSAAFISAHDSFPDKSSRDYMSSNSVVEKAPIVIEHRHKTVYEEIQPIIHREVVQPQVVHETLPIYEKYVEAPIIIDEVREAKYIDSHHTTKFDTHQGVLPSNIRRI